jgi:hypothetical protein
MLKNQTYNFKAKLWLYKGGKASWHFVTVPEEQSFQLKFLNEGFTGGWGSIPVQVTIGNTTWKTSIFPDKKSGTYFLPIKAEVRKKENLKIDDEIDVLLESV